ncbi:MAG: hypothetical protein AB1486_00510 [Planctomycetota bacterium]
MESLFFWCAVVGGTVLVIQTLMLLLGGLGGDTEAHTDVDHDVGTTEVHGHDMSHDSTVTDAQHALFLKLLSLKTIVAFLTFFGLAGLSAVHAGTEAIPTLLIALGAGIAAMVAVAYLMAGLSRLQARGNINLQNAIGHPGKVYLRIPPHRAGPGKVTVVFQGRSVECKAVTGGLEIPTGARVWVVGLSGSDTLEVAPMEKE